VCTVLAICSVSVIGQVRVAIRLMCLLVNVVVKTFFEILRPIPLGLGLKTETLTLNSRHEDRGLSKIKMFIQHNAISC